MGGFIRTEKGRRAIASYLQKRFAVEILLFLQEVHDYQRLLAQESKPVAFEKAKSIYGLFLRENAEMELNFSSQVAREFRNPNGEFQKQPKYGRNICTNVWKIKLWKTRFASAFQRLLRKIPLERYNTSGTSLLAA